MEAAVIGFSTSRAPATRGTPFSARSSSGFAATVTVWYAALTLTTSARLAQVCGARRGALVEADFDQDAVAFAHEAAGAFGGEAEGLGLLCGRRGSDRRLGQLGQPGGEGAVAWRGERREAGAGAPPDGARARAPRAAAIEAGHARAARAISPAASLPKVSAAAHGS